MTDAELDRMRELQDEVALINDEINYDLDVLGRSYEEVSHLVAARESAWVELETLYELSGLPFIDLDATDAADPLPMPDVDFGLPYPETV